MVDRDKRLLLVDDDHELRDQISRYLGEYEFEIEHASDARAMDDWLSRSPFDLIILDLILPGEDGLAICRRLGRAKGPPIIMISAAGDEVDRVLGLEFGADDYLPKPFSPRELLARTRAVLRRRDDAPPTQGRLPIYSFEGFTYDPTLRELKARGGAMILLTAAESSLLGALLMHPQRILTRDELLGPGHSESEPEGRAIDLQVSRLRRKLQGHGGEGLIRTQRGLGYVIDCRVSRG